jgi:hypothetical protein
VLYSSFRWFKLRYPLMAPATLTRGQFSEACKVLIGKYGENRKSKGELDAAGPLKGWCWKEHSVLDSDSDFVPRLSFLCWRLDRLYLDLGIWSGELLLEAEGERWRRTMVWLWLSTATIWRHSTAYRMTTWINLQQRHIAPRTLSLCSNILSTLQRSKSHRSASQLMIPVRPRRLCQHDGRLAISLFPSWYAALPEYSRPK